MRPEPLLPRRAALAALAPLFMGLPQAAQATAARWPQRTTLLDGRVREAAHWQGRPLLVVFWATHCPYCLRHNAKLHQLTQQHADAPAVLAVALDRDPQRVQQYMARHGYRFDVTLDAAAWQQALPVRRVIPTTVPIDAQGRVGTVFPGEMDSADLLQLAQWATDPARA